MIRLIGVDVDGTLLDTRGQIPQANILHLKTNTGETMSLEEYKDQIENPLRKFLDANNGAMRRKIVYIVPVYGIPVKVPDKFAVDPSCPPFERSMLLAKVAGTARTNKVSVRSRVI